MSRTIRSMPYGYHREPHGHKAALIRGDRNIPPDPWDDIGLGHDVGFWRITNGMADAGRDVQSIAKRLATRFKVPYWRAEEMATHSVGYVRHNYKSGWRELKQRRRELLASIQEKLRKAHFANSTQNQIKTGVLEGRIDMGSIMNAISLYFFNPNDTAERMGRHANLTTEETRELSRLIGRTA